MQNTIQTRLGQGGVVAAGMVSGLIQGATGVGGPPGVIALLARGGTAVVSRANVIAFMTGMVLLSIASFWAYGLLTRETVVLGLLASPVCLLAVFAGMAAFRRYGDRMLCKAVLLFVAVGAVVTLLATIQEMIGSAE